MRQLARIRSQIPDDQIHYPPHTPPTTLQWGWRLNHPDLTSSHNYRWPFPGNWATAPGPLLNHTGDCCQAVGDGICAAHTLNGATSAGMRLGAPATGLLVAWTAADILGVSEHKVRLRRAWVAAIFAPIPVLVYPGANLHGANLHGTNLRGANLRDANLRDANLHGTNLRGANLACADLRDANLTDTDLACADLRGANLTDTDLACADLRGANLHGANLHGANLHDTDLSGANLTDTDLSGANLTGALLDISTTT